MHVLYFPRVTDDLNTPRPQAGMARKIVRSTPGGWRCVLLFRPRGEMEEFALWERTRTIVERLEACVAESADTAYLLAQRAIRALRDAGADANETFSYALLVTDGRKLHFCLRGFRCLLWGVPAEGSPPLRLVQEDKHNTIESRDFPSLQRRDQPGLRPFVADPFVVVVDEVNPDGLLPSFSKALETILFLGGPVSLSEHQGAEVHRPNAPSYHLWEEMTNLAAVDLRRLETRIQQLSGQLDKDPRAERGPLDLWRKAERFALPGLLLLNLLLLLLVLILMPGKGQCQSPAPASVPAATAPDALHSDHPSESPSNDWPAIAAPAPEAPPPPAPVAVAPPPEPPPPSAGNTLAHMLLDAPPSDRVHFSEPVQRFVQSRIPPALRGDEELNERARRVVVDAVVQLVANRRCRIQPEPLRVDGEIGERSLSAMRRCAQEGDPLLRELTDLYRDVSLLRDLDALEARVARALD